MHDLASIAKMLPWNIFELVWGAAPQTPESERSKMRTRNHRFSVWLNDKELAHLTRQAEITGLKKEPLIRKLIMGADIQPRPPDNIAQLLREINYIGNNINQIAKKVNTESRVSQAQLEEILHLLGEIYREVKR